VANAAIIALMLSARKNIEIRPDPAETNGIRPNGFAQSWAIGVGFFVYPRRPMIARS
jgi:hypothetical protein